MQIKPFFTLLLSLFPTLAWALDVSPGANIAALVSTSPEGTVFALRAGSYRGQSIVPKNNQQFLGQPGAKLIGADIVRSFSLKQCARRSKKFHSVSHRTQLQEAAGRCTGTYKGCQYSEEVFVNTSPLWRVMSCSELRKGTFYFDYANKRIFLGENPRGKRVEISNASWAFAGEARGVVISGFVIEKYANPAQTGAIEAAGPNWQVLNNEVRYNHGAGISATDGALVRGNRVHHNGQLGVSAHGDNIIFDGNEIYANNIAGFDWEWEAGGSKFAFCNGLSVINNSVHDNTGPGLWTDIDNINVVYDHNTVQNNTAMGIFHEISYDAQITNNTVRYNGAKANNWLYGAQIMLSASQNVLVAGNVVVVSAAGGNGITIVDEGRGEGRFGIRVARNNIIRDNDIKYLSSKGVSGGGSTIQDINSPYYNTISAGNNFYQSNHYHYSDVNDSRFVWNWNGSDHYISLIEAQSIGQETGSSVSAK